MASDQAERPRFYEGQYLGPEDLSAAVDYGRWAIARHDLGAHAWGIAVGLELREVDALAGGVDVYVEPGYAVDGFGRPLVVTSALPVPVDQLALLRIALTSGQTSAAVPVWLRYTETETAQPPYGFAGCADGDASGRIIEGCEVIVGERSLADQRDPVTINGTSTDPTQALQTIETTAPLLCDASVPFQDFPSGDDHWWLIPLGYVRWQPGSPGSLQAATEDDRRATRHLRHYLGVVTENVYAAGDLLRLRPRATMPASGTASTGTPCDDPFPHASGDVDLAYDATTQRVTPLELVWIEGNLRLVGDARMFGGEIELRTADGDTGGVPMRLHRVEANSVLDSGGNTLSGRDLEIRIGNIGDDGRNRLVIGVNPAESTDPIGAKVVVQNDGKVGIGTFNPLTALLAPLTIRGIGSAEELISFEGADGTGKWHINDKLGGNSNGLNFSETNVQDGRLFLAAGGKVGLSTTTPAAKLDVAGLPTQAGSLWLRVGDGGDSGRFWVEYSDDLAPRLVLSDYDDPPRIRFQQIGTGSESAPQYMSWIGHAGQSSPDIAIMGGKLGVGTQQPLVPLHVLGGDDASVSPTSGFLVLGPTTGENLVLDNNEIMARNNGAISPLYLQNDGGDLVAHNNVDESRKVVVKDSGYVGIGTSAPMEQLDVRGNVKFGGSGELFAIGGVQNWRVVSGWITGSGAFHSGSGFSSTRTGAGRYTVTFTTAFTNAPTVVITPLDSAGDRNVATLHNTQADSFQVVVMNMDTNINEQDTAFTFVAFGFHS